MSINPEEPIFDLSLHDPHWDREASCYGGDLKEFYATSALSSDPKNLTERYCRACPAAEDCLTDAVKQGDRTVVIVAGMPREERLELIKEYERVKSEQSKPQPDSQINLNGVARAIATHIRKLKSGVPIHPENPNSNTLHDARWQGKYSKRSSLDEGRIAAFWENASPEEKVIVEHGLQELRRSRLRKER